MLNFAEQTGSGAVMIVWSFLAEQQAAAIHQATKNIAYFPVHHCCHSALPWGTTLKQMILPQAQPPGDLSHQYPISSASQRLT